MKWQQKTLHAAISSLQGVSTSITSFALNNIPEKKAEKWWGEGERKSVLPSFYRGRTGVCRAKSLSIMQVGRE